TKIDTHAGAQPTSETSATDTNPHVVIANDGQHPTGEAEGLDGEHEAQDAAVWRSRSN
ncbi:hypothetical protein EV643_1551, partial [Kribbella sp. VKM Ac-2527]